MSKKYREIMDKVVVTDDMRRRILREVKSADPDRLAVYKREADEDENLSNAFSGRKRFPAAKILAGLAVACALILIAGIIRVSQPLTSPSAVGGTEYEEATEFAAEETGDDTVVGNQDTGGKPVLQSSETADEEMTGKTAENGSAGVNSEISGGGNAGAKSEAADHGTVSAANGTDNNAASDSTSDRKVMPVRLGEPEIRKIVIDYLGPELEISDTSIEEGTLIYTVSQAQSGDVFSYIRINVSDGSVEIENVQTKEISTLTFWEMAGQ